MSAATLDPRAAELLRRKGVCVRCHLGKPGLDAEGVCKTCRDPDPEEQAEIEARKAALLPAKMEQRAAGLSDGLGLDQLDALLPPVTVGQQADSARRAADAGLCRMCRHPKHDGPCGPPAKRDCPCCGRALHKGPCKGLKTAARTEAAEQTPVRLAGATTPRAPGRKCPACGGLVNQFSGQCGTCAGATPSRADAAAVRIAPTPEPAAEQPPATAANTRACEYCGKPRHRGICRERHTSRKAAAPPVADPPPPPATPQPDDLIARVPEPDPEPPAPTPVVPGPSWKGGPDCPTCGGPKSPNGRCYRCRPGGKNWKNGVRLVPPSPKYERAKSQIATTAIAEVVGPDPELVAIGRALAVVRSDRKSVV